MTDPPTPPFPDETPRLGLPYLLANQAQKHVTLNAALSRLDAMVQLAVVSRTLAEPPEGPEGGDAWIIGPEPSGAWTGRSGQVAAWQDGGWRFFVPQPGWLAFVLDEAALVVWTGAAWEAAVSPPDALQNLDRLGLGTEADAENPFAAKLNKALWTARTESEGGDGDLRYTLNKEAPGKTLSLLMQSGWSGRAEIGLTGSDDLAMKVSADGSDWKEALVIDRGSGEAGFPQGIRHPVTGLATAQYLPVPVADLWRLDTAREGTPRTVTLASVSGDLLTLTEARVGEVFSAHMRGLIRVRIWNVSKSLAEPAWAEHDVSASVLRVTAGGDVAGWASGDTLRLGDPNPTGDNTLQMVAVDIAPYMQSALGTVFAQRGVFVSMNVRSPTGPSALDVSGNGASGTAISCSAHDSGAPNSMSIPIMTPMPSPISAANLVFFRERVVSPATDIGIAIARVVGVFV